MLSQQYFEFLAVTRFRKKGSCSVMKAIGGGMRQEVPDTNSRRKLKASTLSWKQGDGQIIGKSTTLPGTSSRKSKNTPNTKVSIAGSTGNEVSRGKDPKEGRRPTLCDLCPEDKRRVKDLIERVARLSSEKERMEKEMLRERSSFQGLLNDLKTQQHKTIQEKNKLESELTSSQIQLRSLGTQSFDPSILLLNHPSANPRQPLNSTTLSPGHVTKMRLTPSSKHLNGFVPTRPSVNHGTPIRAHHCTLGETATGLTQTSKQVHASMDNLATAMTVATDTEPRTRQTMDDSYVSYSCDMVTDNTMVTDGITNPMVTDDITNAMVTDNVVVSKPHITSQALPKVSNGHTLAQYPSYFTSSKTDFTSQPYPSLGMVQSLSVQRSSTGGMVQKSFPEMLHDQESPSTGREFLTEPTTASTFHPLPPKVATSPMEVRDSKLLSQDESNLDEQHVENMEVRDSKFPSSSPQDGSNLDHHVDRKDPDDFNMEVRDSKFPSSFPRDHSSHMDIATQTLNCESKAVQTDCHDIDTDHTHVDDSRRNITCTCTCSCIKKKMLSCDLPSVPTIKEVVAPKVCERCSNCDATSPQEVTDFQNIHGRVASSPNVIDSPALPLKTSPVPPCCVCTKVHVVNDAGPSETEKPYSSKKRLSPLASPSKLCKITRLSDRENHRSEEMTVEEKDKNISNPPTHSESAFGGTSSNNRGDEADENLFITTLLNSQTSDQDLEQGPTLFKGHLGQSLDPGSGIETVICESDFPLDLAVSLNDSQAPREEIKIESPHKHKKRKLLAAKLSRRMDETTTQTLSKPSLILSNCLKNNNANSFCAMLHNEEDKSVLSGPVLSSSLILFDGTRGHNASSCFPQTHAQSVLSGSVSSSSSILSDGSTRGDNASSHFPQTHARSLDECPVQYLSANEEQEKEDQLMESIFFIHTD